jgi:hypothetical protein
MKENKAVTAMRNGLDLVIDQFCDSGDCPDMSNCPNTCKVRQLSDWIWGIQKKQKGKKSER